MRAFVIGAFLGLALAEGVATQEATPRPVPADTAPRDAVPRDAVPRDAVPWGLAPPVLPNGAQMAVLAGDPGKPGPFTVRLKLPAGYRIPPHRHPHTEPVTVVSGELHVGSGDTLDEGAAQTIGPGGFLDLPANASHFAFARVETVIQITTDGPFGIQYVNPADDPSRGP